MSTLGVIGIWHLISVAGMVVPMLAHATQGHMFSSMQRPKLTNHWPDHHPKHQQRQKTGAQD
ncbi:MAG: hypothetical protein KF811_04865 [Dokdonella sp.]|nr:hypothetical protein [Dokdonella sp.]